MSIHSSEMLFCNSGGGGDDERVGVGAGDGVQCTC